MTQFFMKRDKTCRAVCPQRRTPVDEARRKGQRRPGGGTTRGSAAGRDEQEVDAVFQPGAHTGFSLPSRASFWYFSLFLPPLFAKRTLPPYSPGL